MIYKCEALRMAEDIVLSCCLEPNHDGPHEDRVRRHDEAGDYIERMFWEDSQSKA